MEGENGKKIAFIGKDRKTPIMIISMMKVEKYFRKGYEAYLASVIKDQKEGAKLKELPQQLQTFDRQYFRYIERKIKTILKYSLNQTK